jgi:hypothetical protein
MKSAGNPRKWDFSKNTIFSGFLSFLVPQINFTKPLGAIFHEEHFSRWREILKKFCFKVMAIFRITLKNQNFFRISRQHEKCSSWKIAPRGLVKFIWGVKKLRKPEKIAFFEKTHFLGFPALFMEREWAHSIPHQKLHLGV